MAVDSRPESPSGANPERKASTRTTIVGKAVLQPITRDSSAPAAAIPMSVALRPHLSLAHPPAMVEAAHDKWRAAAMSSPSARGERMLVPASTKVREAGIHEIGRAHV